MRAHGWYARKLKRDRERKVALNAAKPRCAVKTCDHYGKVTLGGKWFCNVHAPAWSIHYAILERIRAL